MVATAQAPHPPLSDYYKSEGERRRLLDRLFDRTARDYDRVCGLMDFGSGGAYRKEALLRAGLCEGMRVLDVATGTGPVARSAAEIVGAGNVLALDPSFGMVLQARAATGTPVVRGLAEALPWRDESFEFLSMGYALRHVADLTATFGEFRRVLKPGGRLLILEIARPKSRWMYWPLRFYLGRVVPYLTRLRTRNRDAEQVMHYFWDSIDRCVPPAEIEAALTAAGLSASRPRIGFGMMAEYVATRT